MNNLAIIPARGGSKRIPGKNIRDFLGEPILSYAITAAKESGLFSEVMVSTDDKKTVDVAINCGASVPFSRSRENADDFATLADVILEVERNYSFLGKVFDNICCILPTACLISAGLLVDGFKELSIKKYDSVASVVQFSYPILRALEIRDKRLKMIWPEYIRTRSQDLKAAYHDAGAFYWIKRNAFLSEQTLFCENGGAIVLPELQVQDIDTQEDWKMAEIKYRMLNEETKSHI